MYELEKVAVKSCAEAVGPVPVVRLIVPSTSLEFAANEMEAPVPAAPFAVADANTPFPIIFFIFALPATSSRAVGDVVPIPTLPAVLTKIRLVTVDPSQVRMLNPVSLLLRPNDQPGFELE